ncbi:uncharacterized protein EV420DRAFT_1633621 [Desarmillaria tabescens]|uniref:Uncharacterized protein n=1 Tax=Armillaria tabescens TaxID=1929756 RepID=A0AA39T762_ARMTA|nr:uncharacterized protein EV420DRAFT_1633621 [Desarmillaria tabescens]KAK0469196.1 hypothetical protein EV420DRAFT_1633621 [Desarmillaria tabescens]
MSSEGRLQKKVWNGGGGGLLVSIKGAQKYARNIGIRLVGRWVDEATWFQQRDLLTSKLKHKGRYYCQTLSLTIVISMELAFLQKWDGSLKRGLEKEEAWVCKAILWSGCPRVEIKWTRAFRNQLDLIDTTYFQGQVIRIAVPDSDMVSISIHGCPQGTGSLAILSCPAVLTSIPGPELYGLQAFPVFYGRTIIAPSSHLQVRTEEKKATSELITLYDVPTKDPDAQRRHGVRGIPSVSKT